MLKIKRGWNDHTRQMDRGKLVRIAKWIDLYWKGEAGVDQGKYEVLTSPLQEIRYSDGGGRNNCMHKKKKEKENLNFCNVIELCGVEFYVLI